jgi:hypothetical protein
MSADLDASTACPIVTTFVPQPNDLEHIVMLLEVAALGLSPTTGAEFTLEQLLAEVHGMGGPQPNDADIMIVLAGLKAIEKVAPNRYRIA